MIYYRKGKKRPFVVQYWENTVNKDGNVVRKRRTASFVDEAQAKQLEELQEKRNDALKHGLTVPTQSSLFKVDVAEYLRRRSRDPELAYASFVQDESKFRRVWVPRLGAIPTNLITTPMIIEGLDYVQFELHQTPASRNRHRACLSVFFNDAIARGKATENPVSKIPLKTEVRTKPRINLSESDQFERYLDALRAEGFCYWVIGNILGFTGVRICMANVLQFGDINEEDGVVVFRRIEERAGGSKIVPRIKGKVQIDDEQDAHVVPLLPRLKQVISIVRELRGKVKPEDFVAAASDGGYVHYDTWKDVHKRAVEAANIPPITSHALRRYFATQLKKAGFTRAEIREFGGWSSEAVVGRYDLKDVTHLAEKAAKLRFGAKPRKGATVLKMINKKK